MKKDITVIGLGTFGYELALNLEEQGNSVLAIDKKANLINQIKDHVTAAIQADVTDENVLYQLDVYKSEKVILGMSNSLENLILTITYLKKMNTKYIVAKANTKIQKEILLKIGADEVIQPEIEMAHTVAKKISYPNILESITVDNQNTLVETKIPQKMAGKSLKELNLREKYGILVLFEKKANKYNIITDPNIKFNEDDIIFVTGEEKTIIDLFTK